jgi:hypothetical protein
MGRFLVIALAALAAMSVIGCGGADSPATAGNRQGGGGESTTTTAPPRAKQPAQPPAVEPARCPPHAGNCSAATGRIIYVEAVDPDGDGDAHFVLLSDESVTAPGISVIDVERSLRPHPLPGIGDEISAAGPVYRGSYGQRQIQANELHVGGR